MCAVVSCTVVFAVAFGSSMVLRAAALWALFVLFLYCLRLTVNDMRPVFSGGGTAVGAPWHVGRGGARGDPRAVHPVDRVSSDFDNSRPVAGLDSVCGCPLGAVSFRHRGRHAVCGRSAHRLRCFWIGRGSPRRLWLPFGRCYPSHHGARCRTTWCATCGRACWMSSGCIAPLIVLPSVCAVPPANRFFTLPGNGQSAPAVWPQRRFLCVPWPIRACMIGTVYPVTSRTALSSRSISLWCTGSDFKDYRVFRVSGPENIFRGGWHTLAVALWAPFISCSSSLLPAPLVVMLQAVMAARCSGVRCVTGCSARSRQVPASMLVAVELNPVSVMI